MSTTLAVKGVREQGINAEILTYDADSGDDENILEEEFIHFLKPPREQTFAYSGRFGHFLEQNPYDLYHAQGLWQHPAKITAKKARKFNKPYIITPRGMLYPQQLRKHEWHKHAAMALYQKRDLQQAACIHATCDEEMEHLRDLGITAPVAVIPNPIETKGFLERQVQKPEKMRFGYLGRVHPRKNIERLLYAWDKLGNAVKNKELIIIGAGDESYHQFLKNEAKRLELKNVEFTGFLGGQAKEDKLLALSYLVVPSDFENFGMIIAEALVRGIPVIASTGTPWQDLESYTCGWWVENDVETLTRTMQIAVDMPETEWLHMAESGKKLIEEKYTVESIGEKMTALYYWLVEGSDKPSFVFD